MPTRALLLAAAVLSVAATTDAADSAAVIRAALASHDRAIHVHDTWVRDPYIITGPDGLFYYTGTTLRPSTPVTTETRSNTGLGPGSLVGWHVPVWRSADLITWESLGTPYTLKDTIWYQKARDTFDQTPDEQWRVWAPELHWIGSRWALIHTTPQPLAPKVGGTLVLSSGAELKGPWTSPLDTRIGRRHDPSLFHDTDGTWWMIWGATEIAPLKPDFSDYAGPPVRIGPSGASAKMGHEGCLIQKVEGRYVLFGTGWSTGQMRKGSYNLYYATADQITGPYSERKFAGRFLGHGTPFRDQQGRWWCTAFYNANVPPLPSEGIVTRDLRDDAQTINAPGLTLVPLDVRLVAGDLVIRAKDPRYATPGPDEAQKFSLASPPSSNSTAPATASKAKSKAKVPKKTPAAVVVTEAPIPGRWSIERARTWYDAQPWLVGTNFLPSNAINQLEMWQAETFDPATLDRELGWSAALGMNTHRVFLHDLLWAHDAPGLYARMDQFLALCARHRIRPSFVFFDDCHAQTSQLGPQPLPVPGYHNSGWVTSPARELAFRYSEGRATAAEVARLRGYIQDTLRRFASDPRVLMWELYNEPGQGRFAAGEEPGTPPTSFGDRSAGLLRDAWEWARAVAPSQPICSTGHGSVGSRNIALAYGNSDVLSFHSYAAPDKFKALLLELQTRYPGRPIICTEYLARTKANTIEAILPLLQEHRVGAINWGFVAGKSGTVWPWESRQGKNVDALRAAGTVVRPGELMPEPPLWFHELLRPDGSPYREAETRLIRSLTGAGR